MEIYLNTILKPHLLRPDDLKITESEDERGKLLTVDISQEDMGRIIGKAGVTIKAIRHLVGLFGHSLNENVNVKVNEPRI